MAWVRPRPSARTQAVQSSVEKHRVEESRGRTRTTLRLTPRAQGPCAAAAPGPAQDSGMMGSEGVLLPNCGPSCRMPMIGVQCRPCWGERSLRGSDESGMWWRRRADLPERTASQTRTTHAGRRCSVHVRCILRGRLCSAAASLGAGNSVRTRGSSEAPRAWRSWAWLQPTSFATPESTSSGASATAQTSVPDEERHGHGARQHGGDAAVGK
eukprot:1373431-Rhodomonas_salina.2